MIGLGSAADFRCLGFDEIADVHLVGEPGARTQAGIWADPAVCADDSAVEMGVGRDFSARADVGIAQYATSADFHIIGQSNFAFE